MKKLLLIALLSFGAQAKYTAEDCKVIAEHAEVIMAMRQDGADMSKMYERLTMNISRLMIDEAFSKPQFSTEKHKKQMVTSFKNSWFKSCIKNVAKSDT